MTLPPSDAWREVVRGYLEENPESALQQVAKSLFPPRSKGTREELIERTLEALSEPAVIDRRLKTLSDDAKRALAVLRYADDGRWSTRLFVPTMACLTEFSPSGSLVELAEAGFLFLAIPPRSRVDDRLIVQEENFYVPPPVLARTRELFPPFEIEPSARPAGPARESDGLEWPLRLAATHQFLSEGALRRTQGGSLYKRDSDRLRAHPVLSAELADTVAPTPGLVLLPICWAIAMGIARAEGDEILVGAFPERMRGSPTDVLRELWSGLLRSRSIPASDGSPWIQRSNVWLASVVQLGSLPEETWVPLDAMDYESHEFLLSVGYSLRLVQLAKDASDRWLVRLTAVARKAFRLDGATPSPQGFPQTLLVQPNLEILVYRQGLTPDLIPRLSAIATWKTIGAACTLQLEPKSVYRALESGLTFDDIVGTLDRHGMKPTPGPVLDSLRTWSDKRDRITVYPSAALLEFASAQELSDALARGVPAQRLTDRIAVVAREEAIDYKHFRLTGNRSYRLPPDACVTSEGDDTTLIVDLSRSDLLLDTELSRFAEPSPTPAGPGKKAWRVTPETLQAARQGGMSWAQFEEWYRQRTGQSPPAVVRLLYFANGLAPFPVRRHTVVHLPDSEHFADALERWAATRDLIQARLGPTALSVRDEDLPRLSAALASAGIEIRVEP